MADDYVTVKVLGLKELNAALAELPERIARNALRGAVSAGAAVIRKEARAIAPIFTGAVSQGHPPPGTLKKSVFQKQMSALSGLLKQTFAVGVITGRSRKGKGGRSANAFYWRFVEFGTAKMAARPFLRPAFEAKKQAAVEAIRVYLAARIPREVDKLKQGPRV